MTPEQSEQLCTVVFTLAGVFIGSLIGNGLVIAWFLFAEWRETRRFWRLRRGR